MRKVTRAALFSALNRLEIQEVQLKAPAKDWLLIRVLACGICGTDLKIIKGKTDARPPLIPGHEFCGIVEEVPADVKSFHPGDLVVIDPNIVCNKCKFCRRGRPNLCLELSALGVDMAGGFADYCLVPPSQCYHLKGKIKPEQAILAEPLSCVLYGLKRINPHAKDKVCLLGGGFIGYLMVKMLRYYGVEDIILVEPNPYRRKIFQDSFQIGAWPPDDMEERSFDLIIDCAGAEEALQQVWHQLDCGGRLLIFAVHDPEVNITINPYEIYKKDLLIVGSFINPLTFSDAVDLICEGIIYLPESLYQIFPLEDMDKAFEAHQRGEFLKVIVKP